MPRFESWLVERGPGSDTPDSSLNHLHLYLSSSYALLAIGAVSLLSRTRRDLVAATRAANVVSLVLVVLPLWSLATSPRAPGTRDVRREVVASATTTTLGYLPDIYYIILDGYARSDTLENHYGFDNRSVHRVARAEGLLDRPREREQLLLDVSLAGFLAQHATRHLPQRGDGREVGRSARRVSGDPEQ